ncbi:MAG: hypothetical protein RLY78_1679, partial [Pseudomonadota bacterium]
MNATRRPLPRRTLLAGAGAGALALSGCDRLPSWLGRAADSVGLGNGAFHVLAGSELKDLGPALQLAAQGVGVTLRLSYAGSLDMLEQANAQTRQPAEAADRIDAILPSNGVYPQLALRPPPAARERLFYSRVAIGVKA